MNLQTIRKLRKLSAICKEIADKVENGSLKYLDGDLELLVSEGGANNQYIEHTEFGIENFYLKINGFLELRSK